MIVWRGRGHERREQVANARDSFVTLTPVSDTPAATVATNWSALLPGQTIPLVWERVHGREEGTEF